MAIPCPYVGSKEMGMAAELGNAGFERVPRAGAGADQIDLRSLRRTCATYLRDEAIAQGQLGHSSVKTTKRHYLKTIPADQQARVERLDRELFGTGPATHLRHPKTSCIAEIAREIARGKGKVISSFGMWYARVDSNHRPFAPEANALSS